MAAPPPRTRYQRAARIRLSLTRQKGFSAAAPLPSYIPWSGQIYLELSWNAASKVVFVARLCRSFFAFPPPGENLITEAQPSCFCNTYVFMVCTGRGSLINSFQPIYSAWSKQKLGENERVKRSSIFWSGFESLFAGRRRRRRKGKIWFHQIQISIIHVYKNRDLHEHPWYY